MYSGKSVNSSGRANVFVLNTGRCGSYTFIEACRHISNYTCGHETRSKFTGSMRFEYPNAHIEADNRLSWLLGRLHEEYGDEAIYIHLTRDRMATAKSFMRRYPLSIIKAYRQSILMGADPGSDSLSICLDYQDTVNSNIRLFLRDKSHTMHFRLENALEDFGLFWELIGAEGDFASACHEFTVQHNASHSPNEFQTTKVPTLNGIARKLSRLIVNLPNYIRNG